MDGSEGEAFFSLIFFVPPDHRESVLEALFAAGAGRLGSYERCAFVSSGEGRFRPIKGASPAIGAIGADERVVEDRVECLVADAAVKAAISALRSAHPYEEPAIYLLRLDPRCLGAHGPGHC